MNDLIEALQIFAKYCDNPEYPINYSHDELRIMEVNPEDVSEKDLKRVKEIGFEIDEGDCCFYSFRFGSE